MTLSHSPNIVRDGLILNIDPDNLKSYPGSGSSIKNLMDNSSHTLNGTYSKQNIGMRLTNTSTVATSNVSRLNISSYSSIRTISVWVNIISIPSGNGYVLDARNGIVNGYVWIGLVGTDWPFMYVNGGNKISASTTEAFAQGSWRFLTFESLSSFTDDVTMFARFSNNEGLNCIFGQILFYNKVLSSTEIKQNFNALRGRYGI